MTTSKRTSLASALAFLLLAACGGTTASVTEEPGDENELMEGTDYESVQDLTEYLVSEGHTATVGQSADQQLLAGQGTEVTVDGQTILVFQYPSDDAAETDADTISVDGTTVGTSQIDWVAEPHFYRDGSLIVLYVGNDEATLDTLEDALGAQIAGGSTDDEDDMVPGGDDTTGTGTGDLLDDDDADTL